MIIKDDASVDLTANALEKTIDENSMGLMFKVLQSNQYRYPIKSSIRETASNGVDSHNEREIAKAILNGAPLSDYYEVDQVAEGMAHSSAFDPSYYDLKWLSDEKHVKITLVDRSSESRDLIRFEDWGVGLYGKRLEGFMQLAYSSKRLSKKQIGGFGLGAKSLLATDIDSFRVISHYNGMKFVFDIYETTISSVTEKFNSDGEANKIYSFPKSGYQCYYEKTNRKNGVIIEATVVKSQSYDYVRAVKTQLLYMTGVKFFNERSWGTDELDFHASLMYSDDDIIISNNNIQNRPHVLMGSKELGTLVNYGAVDFEALEMSNLYGSIGILVSPDEVEVSTSRENLLWKKKTREGLQAKLDKVQDTAEAYIRKKLVSSEGSLFEWLEATNNVVNSSTDGSDRVLTNLAKVVDLKTINFKKTGKSNKLFVYSPIQRYFRSDDNLVVSRYITRGRIDYKRYNDHTGEVTRKGIANWGDLFKAKIYLAEPDEMIKKEVIRYLIKSDKSNPVFISKRGYVHADKLEAFVDAGVKAGRISLLADVVVPEEELDKMTQLEEAVEMTAQQKRKLEGKILTKVVYNEGYADSSEFTLDDFLSTKGVYAPSGEYEDFMGMYGFFNGAMYLLSQDAVKKLDEGNGNLVYYKDALITVKGGKTLFNSTRIDSYIIGRCSRRGYTANIDVDSDEDKHELTYGNYPKIKAYKEIYKHLVDMMITLGSNRSNSLPYSYKSSMARSAIEAMIENRLDKDSSQPVGGWIGELIPKNVVFKDSLEELVQCNIEVNKLENMLNVNKDIIKAYDTKTLTLRELDNKLIIKL